MSLNVIYDWHACMRRYDPSSQVHAGYLLHLAKACGPARYGSTDEVRRVTQAYAAMEPHSYDIGTSH